MEEDDKNDGMLRDTVKSIDTQKTSCCTKKVIIIVVIISVLVAGGIAVLLYFLLRKGDVLDGLLERQFPEIKDRFKFTTEESNENFFEISTEGSDPLKTKITIKGNNKLSISSGLGYYLRYHALSQMSWTGDSLKNIKDKKLPPLKEPIYMNTCTHSYSASWWDWERWEREIDWMALNGVNLPLALWGGPLPNEWIDYEHDLQLKILERMRDYGMTPVLSMFSGYVPDTFTKHFPDANVTMGSDWAGFDIKYRTYMLEVTDPQFNKIAKRFIEIQTETYGTSHIYNGDVYMMFTMKWFLEQMIRNI